MSAQTLVAATLLAATTTVLLTLATRPASGQSDQWATLLVAAKPYAKPIRKVPRFYIKRKKPRPVEYEPRRARSRIPAQSGPRAASSPLPESRAVSMAESFAMLPLHTTLVRTISVPPPFAGAFALRPPVDDPAPDDWRTPLPEPKPLRDSNQFKAMVAGGFAALFFVTIFYAAKGGLNGKA